MDETKIVYLVGEENPNRGGLIYDNPDDARQVARENGLRMWSVPSVLQYSEAKEVEV